MFTEVGTILSDLRKKDFLDDFAPANAHKAMRTPTDDPAFDYKGLRDKLKQNKIVADQNMKKEFQKVRTKSICNCLFSVLAKVYFVNFFLQMK